MGDLTISITIYCTSPCDGIYVSDWADWHFEKVKMRCSKCGHVIMVERSLGSEDKILEGSGRKAGA